MAAAGYTKDTEKERGEANVPERGPHAAGTARKNKRQQAIIRKWNLLPLRCAGVTYAAMM